MNIDQFKIWNIYLQSGQNQQYSEIDLHNHIEVILREPIHHLTQEDQHQSGKIHLETR